MEVTRLNVKDIDDSVVRAYKAGSGGVAVGTYESIKKAAEKLGVSRHVLISRLQDKKAVEAPFLKETVSCRLIKRTAEMKFYNGLLVTK